MPLQRLRRQHVGWRLAMAALAALLALWALAWFGVPPLVKSQGERRLGDWLGREVRIGRVEFAPWALALTVHDLEIGAAGGAAPAQLRIGRLHVNAELRSLLRLAPVVQALEVDAPQLRLTRSAEGRYDVDDIVARLRPGGAASSDASPARFALYNLRLSDGRVDFDDQPVGRRHVVEALQLTLPFLSNLPADIEVDVEPRLAFKVNGAGFDSGAQAQPFAKDRHAALKLALSELDLAPWLAYVPAELPIKPLRGRLAADLTLRFSLGADGDPKIAMAGEATLAQAALAVGASTEPALGWSRLAVALKDVQPLAQRVALGRVRLEGATLTARRAADGSINLVPRAANQAAPAHKTTAKNPAAGAASSAASSATPASRPAWQLAVERIELEGTRIDWHDATTQPAAALRVDALDAELGPLRWPFDGATAPLQLQGRFAPVAGAASAAAFTLRGEASDGEARLSATLDALDLLWLAPYVATAIEPTLEGRLRAQAQLVWAAGDAPKLALSEVNAQLEGLRVAEGRTSKAPAITVAAASVAATQVDLLGRRVEVGNLRLDRPTLRLVRDANGRLNLLTWAKTGSAASAASPRVPTASAAWRWALNEAHIGAGDVIWIDEAPAAAATRPVRARAAAIVASVHGLVGPGHDKAPPARTQLTLRLSDQEGPPPKGTLAAGVGRVEWSGQVSAAPLALRGNLKLHRVPLHAVAPYVDAGLPIEILRSEGSWQGELSFAQRGEATEASARGRALIGDLRVHERSASAGRGGASGGDELLSWQSFALDDVVFTLQAGRTPQLVIGDAALSDFYSRLVVTEDGRFNLRDVAAAPKPADAAAPSAAAPASAPVATDRALPIDLAVGGVRLANGKIDFSDRFVKPNYSAALTELNGKLGAFDSTTPQQLATLELRGRAAGTALLEIAGSINPTARPLALDINARATDLELAPLSPYAARYAGYAIERGKLSMEVAYRIEPDGRLDAKNQVILNQLTFGDKVESPDATKLPVLLAVALLKDRHGVIDINLPISGSINDPQFSVFGIVLKVIGNLLVKALTAPFALLAGGGSDDLSFVGFQPGTTSFSDGGRDAIDKVARALTDRPALKMTVTGAADPASEREAIQRATLAARLAAEQRKELLRAGATASDEALPPLTPAQRELLLKRIYDDTSLPDKPRNLIGLARSLPAPDMEALLLKATVVSTDRARELALQRGLAVRDALIAKGLPSERLFLAAPKLRAAGEGDAGWSPRVELSLSTR